MDLVKEKEKRSDGSEKTVKIRNGYAGGKNGSGVYQAIINLMPPHRVYIEAFLGGGAILKNKRPAIVNVGLEIDQNVWRDRWLGSGQEAEVFIVDAIEYLSELNTNSRFLDNRLRIHDDLSYFTEDADNVLIYCDPPYLMETRSTKQKIYKHEFHTKAQHRKLLKVLKDLPCMVMISGYDNELYNKMLVGWRKVHFQGITRRGPRTETVWMNFEEPTELHEYTFLGRDRRERLDIKRQKDRWLKKLKAMPPQRRYAMLSAIDDFKRSADGENTNSRSVK